MLILPRLGLVLTLAITVSAQQTVTITKCQDCSTKAAKYLQSCMVAGGANSGGCQKTYQKKMMHCNQKWCTPKTTKVKVKTGS